ncbi:MtrB/PioB family decaheme-associated outer membrane protein [Ferrimonas aestuarii]|uniref:MtrB/PioB family decaheme-associated outer membrane protein n=1 Tax=Ferrimonas aestuarii TaxID=2569539 RepID=A0A4U1BJH1_9GAMM|nr:MtrB/PioB family decaheme-associated outer membrane protein [Ferrimonas aestuarii]TKB51671.1 MtrB/PioB family decaheme-associated outer membrane protein [Ferrimonas aestuarii]
MKLNLITLALASLSFGAHAFDFGVNSANTEKLNQDKWACKRCSNDASLTGVVGVKAGAADQDNDHASNATGYEDGFAGAVNADLLKVHQDGMRSQLVLDEMGSKHGSASVKTVQAGKWQYELSYAQLHKVDSLNGQSVVSIDGNSASQLETPQSVELEKSRDVIGFAAEAKMGMVTTFVDMNHQIRDGARRASLTSGGIDAANYAQEIDDNTTNLNAGARIGGANWGATAGYQGSWFKNDVDAINYEFYGNPLTQSQATDNQAYSGYLDGFYRVGATHISGRIAAGEMSQDDAIVSWSDPTQSAETQVDTLNANLRLSSRITPRLRVNASIDYSERDNQTDYASLGAITIDPVTGVASSYVGYDVDRQRYKLAADYRIASGLRFSAGIDYALTERSGGDREETDEGDLWAKVTWTAPELFDVRIKAGLAQRSGDDFEANALTSSETSDLMRKYHLADRDRSYVEGRVSYYPTSAVSVDLEAHYAFDDYDDTQVGLIESEDYGLDGSLNWRVTKALNLDLFGGYQWVDNLQYGQDWGATNDDEFGYVGTGARYELADLGLRFELDYTLSYSQSWTDTSSQDDLGNYRQYSHSVELAGYYDLSQKMTLGLSYQYERYFDTDYANIDTLNYPGDGVYGLYSLGQLDNNYNAHMVMLSFSYAL